MVFFGDFVNRFWVASEKSEEQTREEALRAYDLEVHHQGLKVRSLEATVELMRVVGRFILGVGSIGAAYLVLRAQTGEETIVTYIAQISGTEVTGWTTAVIFFCLYLNERRLRRDYLVQHHEKVQRQERIVDANRSSSGLTRRGTTPDEKP